MAADSVRIGTRGSALALWQAHWVRDRLAEHHSGLTVEVQVIKTTGDRILDSPLSSIGDKGLFTREIEHALLAGAIDIAVHSLKDLPTQLPAGLTIGAVSEREDVRDVFLPHPANPARTLDGQNAGAVIATGSLRRRSQLLGMKKGFTVVDIRGNLNTRMRKLEESGWQGMILARAGVVRLGWAERIGETIGTDRMLPAVGQGALGIEIRTGDGETQALVAHIDSEESRVATTAERSLLRRLEGGCQIPIGAYGRIERGGGDAMLRLDAMVGSLDGRTIVRGSVSGRPSDADQVGVRLAEQLLRDGAGEILQSIRG